MSALWSGPRRYRSGRMRAMRSCGRLLGVLALPFVFISSFVACSSNDDGATPLPQQLGNGTSFGGQSGLGNGGFPAAMGAGGQYGKGGIIGAGGILAAGGVLGSAGSMGAGGMTGAGGIGAGGIQGAGGGLGAGGIIGTGGQGDGGSPGTGGALLG